MHAFLQSLNDRQLAAVTLPAQHALILAGAGSGKTRVLTTRIAWLLSTGAVGPHGLLAVTFTNKAAREMSSRLSAMLPVNVRGMWIGTFHGLCNRMLRAHHRDAALPQTFQILDSADQLAAIKRLLKALGVDDQRFPPRNLQYFVNSAKEQGLRPVDVEAVDDYNRRLVELYREYDAQCQREGVVDFAELLLRCYELLSNHEAIREHYQHRFRHILVDEFQDTNVLQYRWLKVLAGGGGSVFAVGDDDQSIYAFRGANVANMAAFEREFRVGNLIKLEQNYRSDGNILHCANTLIAQNRNRLGKDLWTESGDGEPIRVFEAATDTQEASWLVDEIRSLIGEGHARSDVAILYRSNAQSRVIEHALFSAGIAYRVYGGLRFFERAEVKHALAYLRLVANRDDDGAFLRVVNFPPRGIGSRTVEALADAARARGSSLFEAVSGVRGAPAARLAGFTALIERLHAQARALGLRELVEYLIDASGLVMHYRSEREGEDRVDNLRELINAATGFLAEEGIAFDLPSAVSAVTSGASLPSASEDGVEPAAGDATEVLTPLAAFLAHASLEAGENQAGEGSDAVQLMTIHSAKGLEFDAVYVTGLEEGLFPHENALGEHDGLEEERRLMYVAITRARRRLSLSLSQTRMLHGQTRYSLKSRFIDELPEGTLKWLSAGRSAWGERSVAWPGPGARSFDAAPAERGRSGAGAGVPFRVGQSVAHSRFGEGVIVDIEGRGNDARVQVNFGSGGVKWLALSVARLQAA